DVRRGLTGVRFDVDPGLRGGAVRVGERAVDDLDLGRGDDRQALATVVVAGDVGQVYPGRGRVGRAGAAGDDDAVAPGVDTGDAVDLDVRAPVDTQTVTELPGRPVVVVPVTLDPPASGDADVRHVFAVDDRVHVAAGSGVVRDAPQGADRKSVV